MLSVRGPGPGRAVCREVPEPGCAVQLLSFTSATTASEHFSPCRAAAGKQGGDNFPYYSWEVMNQDTEAQIHV